MQELWKVWREHDTYPGWVRCAFTEKDLVFENQEEIEVYIADLNVAKLNKHSLLKDCHYTAVKIDSRPLWEHELNESERMRTQRAEKKAQRRAK